MREAVLPCVERAHPDGHLDGGHLDQSAAGESAEPCPGWRHRWAPATVHYNTPISCLQHTALKESVGAAPCCILHFLTEIFCVIYRLLGQKFKNTTEHRTTVRKRWHR
jgi:hypothetical protein